MPKSNDAILAGQYRKLDRTKNRAVRDKQAYARYNSKADKYRSGTGHGIAVFSPVSKSDTWTYSETGGETNANRNQYREKAPDRSSGMGFDEHTKMLAKQIEAAEKDAKDAKKKRKTARSEMLEARNQHIAYRMAQGKAHGVVVYSTRAKPVVGEVEVPSRHGSYNRYPVDEDGRIPAREVRRIVDERVGYSGVDDGRTARRVYPSRPTPQMMDDYLARPNRSDIVGIDAPKGTRPTVDARTYKKPKAKASASSGSCKAKPKAPSRSASKKAPSKKSPAKSSKPKSKTAGRR